MPQSIPQGLVVELGCRQLYDNLATGDQKLLGARVQKVGILALATQAKANCDAKRKREFTRDF